MIPIFPNFKKIGIEDKTSIESHTHRYQPYSDFNFTSLWAWDTNGDRMVSELNGNLVVRLTDYKTCEPSFSFLGTTEPERTALELIHFAEAVDLSPVLRFIPQESVSGLRTPSLFVEEDNSNFDYIFSVSQLASLRGSQFKGKRRLVRRFSREHPDAFLELKELTDTAVCRQILSVLDRWGDNKKSDCKISDLENEEMAISRLLQSGDNHKLIISCLFLRDVMIGFSVDEILPLQYAISHFFKADSSYNGAYDFLNNKVSQYLATHDVELWNWEQDLGIENLGRSKMSYRPVNFLKKYRVSLTYRK